jgi:hypothetical protein
MDPFTLLLILCCYVLLPFTLFDDIYFYFVKVGSYGCTLSETTELGVFQKNIAPSEPTEIIVL